MRILHLDPDDVDNPLSGGGPIRTREIYRRLARRHEIRVLTPTFPGSTAQLLRDGILYERLGRKVGDHGSSHHLTFLASLPRAVRRFDYDLLVEDLMPPCSATWTPWFARRNRPLIASVQWFFAREYTRRLHLPFHWGEEYGVRMYRHFIVLTNSMKARIESRHPRADCRLVPNGVSDSLFRLDPMVGDFMLFLGRLEVRAKGLDLLVHALAKIPASERIPLVIAGGGADSGEWQAILNESGMRPWIRCVGHVAESARNDLLRTCRFMIMPSRNETFGMTIAEANAAATPTLIWDCAPMNEVASPGCVRLAPFDVDALAMAMRRWIHAPDVELLNRGLAARTWARRYDWNTAAQAQEMFYLSLVESSNETAIRSAPKA